MDATTKTAAVAVGALAALAAWAPGASRARDGAAEALPEHAERRLGVSRFVGAGGDAFAWADDGETLVTVGRRVDRFEAATGLPRGRTELAGDASIGKTSITPDAGIIAGVDATGGWRAVGLWHADTGERLLEPVPVCDEATSISATAIAPDGAAVAVGDHAGRVRILYREGARVYTFPDRHGAATTSVAFAPDGRRVISTGHDGTARVWDPDTEKAKVFRVKGETVVAAAISPDGARLAVDDPQAGVVIFDAASGAEVARIRVAESNVGALAFSPDGKWLAVGTGNDPGVRLFSVEAGSQAWALAGFSSWVNELLFSPDGSALVAGGGNIRKIEVATGKILAPATEGHETAVAAVAISPDGAAVASTGGAGAVRLWDAATGKARWGTSISKRFPATAVAFSRDGSEVIAGTNRAIVVIDGETGDERARLAWDDDASPTALFLAKSGALVSVDTKRRVRVWDLGARRMLREGALTSGGSSSVPAAMLGDGRTVAVAWSRWMREGADEDGETPEVTIAGHVVLWDVETGKETALPVLSGTPIALAAGPDAGSLIVALDGETLIWDIERKAARAKLPPARPITWTPDGERLLTVETGAVIVRDPGGAETGRFDLEASGWVGAIAAFPDGKRVATADHGNTILIWKLPE